MSFFDDEGDEPPTRVARPRRPAPRGGSPRGRSGGPSAPQQIMVRRALAVGVGAIVIILIVIGINGCLNSREKNALKDYNRDVNAIAEDSNVQVSQRLFEALSDADGVTIRLRQTVNDIRVAAQGNLRRAEAISVPDDMKQAHRHLLVALSLRAEGVEKIAADLPDATGSQRRAAVVRMAGAMREFLASDVLFSQRVDPYILEALKDHDIGGQDVVESQFLPDDTWLDADTVGNRLGVRGAGSSTGQAPRSGTHGHGLTSVAYGSTTLQPYPVNNRVTYSLATPFTVVFQNQGSNDEFDVVVRVRVTSQGRTVSGQKRVDETNAGQPTTTEVRLNGTPTIGSPVSVTVTILKVSGEVTTTNNSRRYVVSFSQ